MGTDNISRREATLDLSALESTHEAAYGTALEGNFDLGGSRAIAGIGPLQVTDETADGDLFTVSLGVGHVAGCGAAADVVVADADKAADVLDSFDLDILGNAVSNGCVHGEIGYAKLADHAAGTLAAGGYLRILDDAADNGRRRIDLPREATGIAVGGHGGVLYGNSGHGGGHIFGRFLGADIGADVASHDTRLARASDGGLVDHHILHGAVEHAEEAGIDARLAAEIGNGMALSVEVDSLVVRSEDVERGPSGDAGHIDVGIHLEPGSLPFHHKVSHRRKVLGSAEDIRRCLSTFTLERDEGGPGGCIAYANLGKDSAAHFHGRGKGKIVGRGTHHGYLEGVGLDIDGLLRYCKVSLDRLGTCGHIGDDQGELAVLDVSCIVQRELGAGGLQNYGRDAAGIGRQAQVHSHYSVGTEGALVGSGPFLGEVTSLQEVTSSISTVQGR